MCNLRCKPQAQPAMVGKKTNVCAELSGMLKSEDGRKVSGMKSSRQVNLYTRGRRRWTEEDSNLYTKKRGKRKGNILKMP